MKSRMLATLTAALVLVTASACVGSGSAGQSMEKMTATPNTMEEGGARPEGEMMPDGAMTKPEAMKSDDVMMADPDAMTEHEAMPEEGAMSKSGSTMTPPETMVAGESMAMEDLMRKDASGMGSSEGMTEVRSSIEPQDRYVSYSPEALTRAHRSGRAVLFFRADWCPTCRAADAAFKANLEQIPDDVSILAVNYDRESALKQRYNITYQHSFVQVDGSGKPLSRWGGGDVKELLVNLQ